MEIKRNGSQPSGKGPGDYFSGSVRIDPLFQAPDPALVQGSSVTFEPGARTAWRNLLLAGDWTDTGLPATIEGAIRSGNRAAELVSEQ